MRFNTPIRIALFISSLLFVIAGLLFYSTTGTYFFLSLLFFFIFSVLFIYKIVKQMLYEKIKVIYKNSYKFKGASKFTDLDIENVEQEVEDWAAQKEHEIMQMKESENTEENLLGMCHMN
ncbi:MAG TPA: hypothetical protein DIU20_11665 [Cryomorphaceae bacterium]|nr:hypothetical protein [Cryomorphaceae bacterium]